ncbi:non-canonical purine NTP pyrophosphatase, partial [Methylobacterium crusticola]
PSFDKTVAQLALEDKNRISHRGSAAARILTALKRLPQSRRWRPAG